MPFTAYEELDGSPIVTNDVAAGFSCTREFKVLWSDTIALDRALLGYWEASGGGIVYTPPSIFPTLPGVVCRRTRYVPFGKKTLTPASGSIESGTTNQPEYALCTADYSAVQPQYGTGQALGPAGTYLGYSDSTGTSSIALPGTHMSFTTPSGGTFPAPPEATISVQTPSKVFSLKWERVPYSLVPWKKLDEAAGKVNSAEFFHKIPESVLYLGYDLEFGFQFNSPSGAPSLDLLLCNLNMKFHYKAVQPKSGPPQSGWNWMWVSTTDFNGFARMRTTVGNKPLHESYDFASLFTL